MAQTKSVSAKRMGRDALPKYLGIKISAGNTAKAGNIIIRQRGTRFTAGKNVRQGSDDTLYAAKEGKVKLTTKMKSGFNNIKKEIKIVSVE